MRSGSSTTAPQSVFTFYLGLYFPSSTFKNKPKLIASSAWLPLNNGETNWESSPLDGRLIVIKFTFFLHLFQDFVKVIFFFCEADMVTYANWFVAGAIRPHPLTCTRAAPTLACWKSNKLWLNRSDLLLLIHRSLIEYRKKRSKICPISRICCIACISWSIFLSCFNGRRRSWLLVVLAFWFITRFWWFSCRFLLVNTDERKCLSSVHPSGVMTGVDQSSSPGNSLFLL